jgi:hypothetical protein
MVMKRAGRSQVGAVGRAAVLAVATAAGLFLYQWSQDAGGKAYDHYFSSLPEESTLQQDLFFLTFWLLLPALLAALAVGLPAVRLRLAPRAIVLWCCGGSALAMSTRFPFWSETWGFVLLELYAMSLTPVLLLAWFLVRCRRASRARAGAEFPGKVR